ncbi:GDSL-type esterase/lipase family protein [Ferviditalea candida]|uniref:GDSL-type esterase/lipase family protein n=1 Tax=Ferviditalea candida TaxID=3108399 RepID=A0ABU5ZI40_9BACL|nr:GDSL-type esterase/lipase family protein [Paenibacillaceae bacterium T2]
MRSTRLLWRSAWIAAVAATVLLLSGFVYAVRDLMNPSPSTAVPPPKATAPAADPVKQNKIQIVALGDSLTKGMGDVSGNGYVQDVKRLLAKDTGKSAYVISNLGVNGYRSDQLLADLNTKPFLTDLLKRANLILLTIGGNDLFNYAWQEFNLTTNINPEALLQRLPPNVKRLDSILTKLAKVNPDARIVYVGLYNPFIDTDKTGKSSDVIQRWNYEASLIADRYPNVTVVPTFDLFEKNPAKYLYTDHFHPNQEGYLRIAERIVQALK